MIWQVPKVVLRSLLYGLTLYIAAPRNFGIIACEIMRIRHG
jgi:hypothetical protein